MRKKKKIAFITGSLAEGGAQKVIAILASQCANMSDDVYLIVLRDQEEAYKISEKVKCIRLKGTEGKFQVIKRIIALRKIIEENSIDTLIPFLPIISLYTLIAKWGLRKRIIMTERADPNINIWTAKISNKDRVGSFFMRTLGLYGLADWMVFQTPDAQSYYSKRIQKKSCIIPNPLDTDSLPPRFEGEREKTIIAAGRFSEEKNFTMLLQGFAKFHKDFPDYKLLLCGEGKMRGEFESLVNQLCLKESVTMPGFAKDLPHIMQNKAMYISTSNHEGISNSMLEALGMGIPTIVTDCPVGGARMFVRTDDNGILIPMNDESALVEAMKKIASDYEYADRISRNAVAIREELSARKICERWLELI